MRNPVHLRCGSYGCRGTRPWIPGGSRLKLGIIGGALQGIEAAYLAQKAGYETLVLDRREDAPARSIADGSVTVDVAKDPEKAAKALGCSRFVEFGPGKVLSGLVKKIDASLATCNVADVASLGETVAALG